MHSVTSQTVRKCNDGKDEAQELWQNLEEELQRSESPQKLLLGLLLQYSSGDDEDESDTEGDEGFKSIN